MTNSILEAANRTPSVKRVIITSSAVTLIPFEWLSNPDHERIYTGLPAIPSLPNPTSPANFANTERDINSHPTGPYHCTMEAYWASKALSRIATHKFLTEKNSHFEIINLLPSVVIGPDELATKTSELLTGTRALALAPILGQKIESPLVGQQVHLDDVARGLVDALDTSVSGNADYVFTSNGCEGIEWDDAKGMFKGEGGKGKLKLPLDGSLSTMKWRVDVSTIERAFGWKCRSFEETMRDLVGQYLRFLENETQ
jgi:nucleoside-diphosphate-sugar epimerase